MTPIIVKEEIQALAAKTVAATVAAHRISNRLVLMNMDIRLF